MWLKALENVISGQLSNTLKRIDEQVFPAMQTLLELMNNYPLGDF